VKKASLVRPVYDFHCMSCCPAESWGELKNTDYKAKGVVDKVDGLDIYRVGSSDKCIIWNYDIFGFNGGRTRQFIDLVASHGGYMVIMPDYYRGTMNNPFDAEQSKDTGAFLKKNTDWEGVLKHDWEKVHEYALEHGAKSFGTAGTCWGSCMVLRLCTLGVFKAGVSMHPSHSPIWPMVGDDEEELLKLVTCPQLFMPCGQDHENVQAGGLDKKVLGDLLEIEAFPDMQHGWTVRGDLSYEGDVEREVKRAFHLLMDFLKKHV